MKDRQDTKDENLKAKNYNMSTKQLREPKPQMTQNQRILTKLENTWTLGHQTQDHDRKRLAPVNRSFKNCLHTKNPVFKKMCVGLPNIIGSTSSCIILNSILLCHETWNHDGCLQHLMISVWLNPALLSSLAFSDRAKKRNAHSFCLSRHIKTRTNWTKRIINQWWLKKFAF